MNQFKILTAVVLAAGAVAISPSIAQDHGGHAMGGAPNAVAAASAPRTAPAAPAPETAAGANMRATQMNSPATGGTWQGHHWNGGTSNGGRVATNNWNGNWNGRGGDFDRDRRFHRGPGFAFGFGAPYYDDYAYAGYPYDNYAYYNDPYYSDTFAYDTGPAVGVAVTSGADPAYCMRRFRSYDPASGTYLGYDGMRHPCP